MIQYLFNFHLMFIFVLALIISFLMKKRCPSLCYALWVFVLIKLILPIGVVDQFIPYHFSPDRLFESIAWSKSVKPQSQSQPIPPSAILAGGNAIHDQAAVQQNPIQDLSQDLSLQSPPTIPLSPAVDEPGIAYTFAVNQKRFSIAEWAGWSFFLLWIMVSLSLLWSKTTEYLQLKKKVESWPILQSGFAYQQFLYCVKLVGCKTIPILRVAPDGYPIPFTLGIRKSAVTVVIPESLATTQHTKKLRAMVCHELYHIKKRDYIVNIIRFISIILFHYHPLRLLSDRYVTGFQEITTDLKTIQRLRIPKEEYVQVLLSKFLELDTSQAYLRLTLPFLDGESSVIRRLFFIKYFNMDQSKRSKVIPHFLFTFFMLFLSFNITLYASMRETRSIHVGPSSGVMPFPVAENSFPSILRDTGIIVKEHLGLIWILEPRHGIFAYRMDERDGPRKVASYLFEQELLERPTLIGNDFALTGNTIYYAMGDQRFFSYDFNRICILSIGEDLSLQKVGEIPHHYPRVLKTIDQTLWVSGSSENFFEGQVSIFDISVPEYPFLVDSEYYDSLVTLIEYLPQAKEVVMCVGNDLVFFDRIHSLTPKYTVSIDKSVGYLSPIDEDSIVVIAYESNSMGLSSSYIVLLSKEITGQYAIKTVVLLNGDENHQNLSVDKPLVFNPFMVLSFYGYCSGLFCFVEEDVQFVSYSEKVLLHPILIQDEVITFSPETMVFARSNFRQAESGIFSWNTHR